MKAVTAVTGKHRLLSLDVFRGLTVIIMIMVNNPGDGEHVYGWLEHSEWNGCTPADLVFPFFLFIVGVSIPYALERKKMELVQHGTITRQAIKRAAILFALGLFLSLFPEFDFKTIRIPGILTRIAEVYLICVLIYTKSTQQTIAWITASLLIVYYLLMVLVPVPGVGYANLEPGTNLASWLDRAVLTTDHLYKPYSILDPAEVLTTMTATGTGLIGVMAGSWLRRTDKDNANKIAWLFSTGFALIVAGLIWDTFFPINKLLWTSSFVLYTGGWAIVSLAFCYWIIDVQGYKWFTKPFVVYGMNAITVFCLSIIIKRVMKMISIGSGDKKSNAWKYVYEKIFSPLLPSYPASLAFSLAFALIWMGILWWMYSKKIFIKV